MRNEFYAHTPSKHNTQWHMLPDHILTVSRKARCFAKRLGYGAGEIAYYLGLLHDLGKFTKEFQQYLLDCHNNPENPPTPGSAPHKQYGAFAATLLDKGTGKLWWLPLHGHHGGMKSPENTGSDVKGTFERAQVTDKVTFIRQLMDTAAQTDPEL
ncbi:MAG: CRISPR-associated endonuclease Cas3'', partial [Proteobacteria bacterium]